VAIEVAGHGHCHGSHSHGESEMNSHRHCEDEHCSDESAHNTDAFFEKDHTCCGPHEEIPLSHGMVDESRVHKMPEMRILPNTIIFTASDTNESNPVIFTLAREGPFTASFYDPLSHIILIV